MGNLTVTSLAQDQTGYIWLGTENGLFRYNGVQFERFAQAEGLEQTSITALLAQDGQLWVGTYDSLYRREGGRLVPVLYQGKRLPVWPGQMLAAPRPDTLLFISERKLLRRSETGGKTTITPYFSARQIERQPVLGNLISISVDVDGSLWLGCGEFLCHGNADGITVWSREEGLPADHWNNIIRAADGALWSRGAHHVVALAAGAARFADRTPPGDLMRKISQVAALATDADHNILSSIDTGLARWRQDHWELFEQRNGLKTGGGVTAVLSDRDRGLWVGTRGHGLIRWRGYGMWENWTTAQGLPDDVALSFARDGAGRMHVGTRSGPVLMEHRSGPIALRAVTGHTNHQWADQAIDVRGQVWSATYSGLLFKHDAQSGAELQVAILPETIIYRLLFGADGALWIGANNGVYVLEHPERGGRPRRPVGWAAMAGFADGNFSGACRSKEGALWFLSEHALLRFHQQKLNRYALKSQAGNVAFDSLACGAGGALWLGSSATGLWQARLGRQGLELAQLKQVPLHNTNVLAVYEDSRGWLWVGTGGGIAVRNGTQWRRFNQNDGLVWDDLNGRAFYEDTDRSIWIATSGGVSHLLRPERLFAAPALGGVLESVTRNDQPLGLRPGMSLPWSEGALNFNLASLTFQHRAGLRFRYRLDGLERAWSLAASPGIRYAALAPGQYRLQYGVADLETGAMSPPREIAFSITPPWWQTGIFYAVCGITAIAAVVAFHRYRLRSLTLKNARMEKLVRELVRERTLELEQSQDALRLRAMQDGLTKAWNRAAMMEYLEEEVLRAGQLLRPFLVVLLDLDHFKRINDTYGHLAGDRVLREVVARLGSAVRSSDLVGRYGGEEFLLLLPELDRARGVAQVERLRRAIEAAPVPIDDGQTIDVTASFGVAEFDPARPSVSLELIGRADAALYRAKAQGRNRVLFDADEP
ncbi:MULTISPECIES: ligand-binding sensor domain-containing diguanylate cyclase [unclassified Duganella]|uniref:ligand-binding sensor domain-containing diguanylate cyclase n=1 Tax=unclassified Duganella TaxID=2636909 RepID=UPI0013147723|nr:MULTISPECIES: ligand-binding sensor domain-containing diguanylate cyclase [unclassified Duganella]